MENTQKQFCGNGKEITTQYGKLLKISFSQKDLDTLLANLNKGWVNTVVKAKKEPVEGKPTHYLEIDNWKAEQKDTFQPVDNGNDLPF